MIANDGSGDNPSRDEWKTPKWLFKILNNQYPFSFDCCASEGNSKTQRFASDFIKINHIRGDLCWMNPPFSKAYKMFEHFFKEVYNGIMIYRCDNMETKIWQEVILPKASWIFVFNKRIAYEGMKGKGSRFPSALIGLNVKEPEGLKGVLLKVS